MSEIETREERITTADGLELSCRVWLPAGPRAVVVIVHGLGEHSGRYDHVARRLAGNGFACWAPDCRGHGRSPGLRVHVDRFDDYVADVAAARERVREAHPRLPLFLLGHSQGGPVVLLAADAAPAGLAGVAVTSPFLGIHPASRPPAFIAAVARVLSRLVPKLRLANGVNASFLSRDPAVGPAYMADPLVSHKVSARWFTETLAAQERALALAPRLTVPALVMQSGADRLVDADATRGWVAAAPPDLVTFVEWPGLYHEMLNEPERDEVVARLKAWLEARLAA